MDDLKLSHIEIFDVYGRSVYVRDNAELDMSPLMQDTNTLKKEFFFFNIKDQSAKKFGIMSFGDKIALISICPILQGDRKAPSFGVIVMIRIADTEMIENIKKKHPCRCLPP